MDIQTRAVFVEWLVLNVPTGLVAHAGLLVQYGAEGDVVPSVEVRVSGLYQYARVLALAAETFTSDSDLVAAGAAAGVLAAAAVLWAMVRCSSTPLGHLT